jgi:hypothetical protein
MIDKTRTYNIIYLFFVSFIVCFFWFRYNRFGMQVLKLGLAWYGDKYVFFVLQVCLLHFSLFCQYI